MIFFTGNAEILKNKKYAYICSQKFKPNSVLVSIDWSIAKKDEEKCVICGNHSNLEKDVFYFLLRGKQPLILVLARGLKTRIEPEIKAEVDKGRLLIIAPFPKEVKRVTKETAYKRNQTIIELADEITVGYMQKGGSIEKLLSTVTNKPITFLS
jgi:NAD(P)H-hydrate repair Nnr-like enzyme with NAD(P)H-hydrate dehydratase domain